MLEERKLKKEKGGNTSILLLRNQIMKLLARANLEMSEEHQAFFEKSIEQLTFRGVGEEKKFTWIRQAASRPIYFKLRIISNLGALIADDGASLERQSNFMSY